MQLSLEEFDKTKTEFEKCININPLVHLKTGRNIKVIFYRRNNIRMRVYIYIRMCIQC